MVMRIRHCLLMLIASGAAMTAASESAKAGCTVPFTLTTTANPGPAKELYCTGPWLRSSTDLTVAAGQDQERFYCADQTFFSMWGGWGCLVETKVPKEEKPKLLGTVDFCVERTGPAQVNLTWNGQTLTVNADNKCASAATAGILGYPQAAQQRDGDVFDFAGTPGEQIKVRLERDGTAGGSGAVATLEARSKAGRVLATRTAKLPIILDVGLADAGLVLAVNEAQRGQGDPYRGGYVLDVQPVAGNLGKRLLRPRRDVEP